MGVFSFKGEAAEPGLLSRMRDTLAHRGPDDAGLFINPDRSMALGFRRLAILDLSPAGHQPMTDDSGRYTIVFNGEIYNFLDLRSELEKQGTVFRSRSDTEVILALYARKGEAMLADLRGMFALAIWDEKEKRLFLARDRAGKKPLYWTRFQDKFIFASEIKAILEFPGVPRRLNEEALYHYLTFRTTPAPLTLFEGIFKLPCGHSMSVDAQGRMNVREYWDAVSEVKPLPGKSAEDFARPLLEILKESVRYRMVSDVPFGVFLSGGMDSSANLALMAELMDRPVEAFSIGYTGEDEKYSELAWARRSAAHFKANYHEMVLQDQDMVEMLPALVHHQDEPLADPVCVPVHAVSKLARKNGVLVCQVGEGSDELFCGYPDWMEILKLYQLSRDSRFSSRAWKALLGALLPLAGTFFHRMSRWSRVQRTVGGGEIFWSGAEAFSERSKKRLLSRRLRRQFKSFSSWEVLRPYHERYLRESCWKHPIQWMALADLDLRLPELLLMRVDKMSMANSVETRAPFLDHRFIEFALGIPPEIRIEAGRSKEILRRSLAGTVPDEILRRPKQGFAVPVKEWFGKALGDYAVPSLRRFVRETDYFEPGEIERWIARGDDRAWQLLNFVLWHEKWIN